MRRAFCVRTPRPCSTGNQPDPWTNGRHCAAVRILAPSNTRTDVDVYKALYRHFQTWNDRSRPEPRVVYRNLADIRVRVIYTDSAAQAARLERALTIRFNPPDNPQQLLDLQVTPAMERTMDEAANADWLPIEDVPF